MRRFPFEGMDITPVRLQSRIKSAPALAAALLVALGATPATAASVAASPEVVATQLRDAATAGHDIAFAWVSELTTRFGPRPSGSANE